MDVERQIEERRKLNTLLAAFSLAMKHQLLQKLDEGWWGWDEGDRADTEALLDRLIEHVERAKVDYHQWVDVANLAAFLWWRAQNLGR